MGGLKVGLVGLLAVLPSACTRDNPAFGDGDGDGEDDGPNDGDTTIGAGTTRGGGEGEGSAEGEASSAGATSVADTSASVSGPDGGPSSDGGLGSSGGSEETGTECALEPAPYHGIESEPSLGMLFGECPASDFLRLGSVEQNGTEVTAFRCSDGASECPCDGSPITLFFDLAPPPLPECVDLWVQLDPDCSVSAYSVRINPELPPLLVVSNVLHPGIPLPSGLVLQLAEQPTDVCEGTCRPEDPRSHYALVHDGPVDVTEIPPSGEPVLVPSLPPYEVMNEHTGVGDDCMMRVSWQANLP